jgi:DNA-binding GntR family transcriptional regulator
MNALPRIRLDRQRLAAPQVLERLREAILDLELVPGTVLGDRNFNRMSPSIAQVCGC